MSSTPSDKSPTDWRLWLGILAVIGWSMYGLVGCLSSDEPAPRPLSGSPSASDAGGRNATQTAPSSPAVETWSGGSDRSYLEQARTNPILKRVEDDALLRLGHFACRDASIAEFGWSDAYDVLSDSNGTLSAEEAGAIIVAAQRTLCPGI